MSLHEMPTMEPINYSVDESSEVKPAPPSLRNTYLSAVPALLFILAMGFVSSYPAPATVDMKARGSRFRDITEDQITWIASLPTISGIFGNAFSGFATHHFGRKAWLLYSALIYISGWLSIVYAQSIAALYLGRILCGFCAASSIVTVPTYLVEIAPTEIRGRMTTLFHVALSIGMVAVMAFGMFLRWSWLAVVGAAIIVVAAVLLLFVPESPQWLVRESRIGEALKGLEFLRGRGTDVKMELKELVDSQSSTNGKKIEAFQLREVLDQSFYKPFGISVALMFFFTFSGMAAIMSYTVDIFQKTGSSIQPNVASIIVAVVQFLGTVVSSYLMDKTGRRTLYLTSGLFVTLSLIAIGTYSYIISGQSHPAFGWIPLVCLIVYIFSLALGLGPIAFVIPPEISPLRSRSFILAVSALLMSFFSFILIKMYNIMQTYLGVYGLYWFYSTVSFSSMIFGYFILPETRGMNLQDIQTMLAGKNGASS